MLILAHTHAACDVFASRTPGLARRVDIRTLDSLVVQIAAAYHIPLQLPPDAGAWARMHKDGYRQLARKVAEILRCSPMIARSLALRYPIIVCDEHQDANADQEAIVLACYKAGASLRIFGDPMQRIYGSKKMADIEADTKRWESLKGRSEIFEELDKPHRWPAARNGLDIGYWQHVRLYAPAGGWASGGSSSGRHGHFRRQPGPTS